MLPHDLALVPRPPLPRVYHPARNLALYPLQPELRRIRTRGPPEPELAFPSSSGGACRRYHRSLAFKWKTPLRPNTMIHPLGKLWFAADSPLEEDGFELAVPPRRERLWAATPGKHCRFGPEPVSGSAFHAAVSNWQRPEEPFAGAGPVVRVIQTCWSQQMSDSPPFAVGVGISSRLRKHTPRHPPGTPRMLRQPRHARRAGSVCRLRPLSEDTISNSERPRRTHQPAAGID
jgi:hypothetical protein